MLMGGEGLSDNVNMTLVEKHMLGVWSSVNRGCVGPGGKVWGG